MNLNVYTSSSEQLGDRQRPHMYCDVLWAKPHIYNSVFTVHMLRDLREISTNDDHHLAGRTGL